MKSIQSLIVLLLFIFSANSMAKLARYRAIWNSNPHSSLILGWETKQGSPHSYKVFYGTVDHGQDYKSYPNIASIDTVHQYKRMKNTFARLINLQPNTIYYYVITNGNFTSPRFYTKTAPNSPETPLSFIMGGDSRNNRDVRRRANRTVSKLASDAVFFGGDMINVGTARSWKRWFDDWQYTIAPDGQMTPIVAARGNHERDNEMLEKLFLTPRGVYYAMTFGGDLFRSYTLNSEISQIGNQLEWLKSDLDKNPNIQWRFAQYHRPIRPHTAGKSNQGHMYTHWSHLFYEHGFQLVSESDAHTVKSTYPIIPDRHGDEGFVRDDLSGTVYVGEGCWGAPLRENNNNKSWTRASGQFNQFKWVFVSQSSIELRTVRIASSNTAVSSIEQLNYSNRFTIPENLSLWNPVNGSGEVIRIFNTSFRKNGVLTRSQ